MGSNGLETLDPEPSTIRGAGGPRVFLSQKCACEFLNAELESETRSSSLRLHAFVVQKSRRLFYSM